MDADELLSFEDPAPERGGALPTASEESVLERPPSKRRLRYRPDVEVSGRRYKGHRVSRAHVELDTRSIGLFDDIHEGDAAVTNETDVFDDGSSADSAEKIKGPPSSDSEVESDLANGSADEGDANGGLDQSADTHPAALVSPNYPHSLAQKFPGVDDGERAIVEQLAEAKRSDVRRALAVKKQKVCVPLFQPVLEEYRG